jgi:hypothetical protein
LPPDRPIFALDENFPEPILLEIVARYTLELDLRHIRHIDDRLTGGLSDDRLILALHQLGVEGLVTNDDRMLALPEVLAMVRQTGFTLVTCRRTGHDPLVATGLLLAHLGRIARRHRPGAPQVWRLSRPDRGPDNFEDIVAEAEKRTGRRVAAYRLAHKELSKRVLDER